MSERERQLIAFERNKLRNKSEARSKRDWLPVTLSIVSLFVAVVGTFFNVLLQEDDFRIVIGKSPTVFRNNVGEIQLYGGQELTFINSGNRAVAITNVESHARVVSSDRDRQCKNPGSEGVFGSVLPISFDIKPFVLKAGEIQHLSAKPIADLIWTSEADRGEGFVQLSKKLHESKGAAKYLVCITLSLVTPDSVAERWQRPAFLMFFEEETANAHAGSFSDIAEQEKLFEVGNPLVVIADKRVRWISR